MAALVLALAWGCTPVPTEVMTDDPSPTTAVESSTGSGPLPTTSTTDAPATGEGTTAPPADTTGSSGPDPDTGSTGSTSTDGETTGPPPPCVPLLAEVLYRVNGNDDRYEWVRLYNPCDDLVDLGAFSLGWGGDYYTYGVTDLSGTIDPGGCLLVGGSTSSGSNGDPVYDLVIDFEPDLQNSGPIADAVGLFEGLADDIDSSSIPVDAVIYGTANSSGLLGSSGTAVAPQVGESADNQSLRRTTLGESWEVATIPTPNECPTL